MNNHSIRRAAILLTCACLLSSGCSALRPKPDATRFYVLRAPSEPSSTSNVAAAAKKVLRIGPGQIAAYLDVSAILVQEGSNQVRPLAFHHWAEPLEKGVEGVLTSRLRVLLPNYEIAAGNDPLAAEAPDQLTYEIGRLEGVPGKEVVLEVSWKLLHDGKPTTSETRRFTVQATGSSEDVEGYVGRLSRAVAEWSEAVAVDLSK